MAKEHNEEKDWYSIAELSQMLIDRANKYKNVPEMDYNGSYFQKLAVIKKYYEAAIPEFMEEYQRSGRQHYYAYPFDWARVFTPIEFLAWCSIRGRGVPLFPQLPVDKYFIDFANPFLKIGLELDGKDFHNKEKDTQRDVELKKLGWRIIRITGKEMERSSYRPEIPQYESSDMDIGTYIDLVKDDLLNTGDGVIRAMHILYWGGSMSAVDKEVRDLVKSYCIATIDKHTLI